MQVRTDRLAEYTAAHEAVWPDMQAGAAGDRLGQLLAVHPARTDWSSGIWRPTTSTRRWPGWPPTRSTTAGRPRCRRSSRTTTAVPARPEHGAAHRVLPPGLTAVPLPDSTVTTKDLPDDPDSLRRPGPARRLRHRGAVVGVRQLGHPVQGVRHEGRAAGSVREDRRRRAGERADRCGAAGLDAHPVGPGRGLVGAGRSRGGAGRGDRGDQLEPVPGRRLQAGVADQRRRADPGEGDRAPRGVHRRDAGDRAPRI